MKFANEVEATLYCDELADTIFYHGSCTDQIFNADETGLNYKILPSKTLATKADRKDSWRKGAQQIQDLCANTSGSFRLPLLVNGKYMNPRTSKNYWFQSSSVVYKNQKSDRTDVQLFKDWFFEEFV